MGPTQAGTGAISKLASTPESPEDEQRRTNPRKRGMPERGQRQRGKPRTAMEDHL